VLYGFFLKYLEISDDLCHKNVIIDTFSSIGTKIELTILGMVGIIINKNYVEYYRILKKEELTKMMKSTGIVRKVDELGRVVIPIELRRTLGIGEKDALEIYVDGERIMLKKYEPACIFCGNAENVTYFKGKIVCNECLTEMPIPVTK
jgi:transcriptional pleiotropic regulator of transition state genes